MVRNAMTGGSFPKVLPNRSLILIAAILSVLSGSAFTVWRFQSQSIGNQATEVSTPQIATVTALGRLEPKGELVKLSAPTSSESNRVEKLLVKEGDRVKAGQVIAVLDNRDRRQATLQEAQAQVKIAQNKLDQVLAGAKSGEIEAQRATIARVQAERRNDLAAQEATVDRLQAELRNAEVDYQRYQSLYAEGAISAQERDSRRLEFQAAQRRFEEGNANLNRIRSAQQQQINEAKATLDKIAEVRPVDVQVAQAEVDSALAAVKRAEADLATAYIRAPQTGQILKIHARPGEIISSEEGIADLGQTQQMYAIAEVYESDVQRIRPGQKAKITSTSLPSELRGTVEQVGLQVLRQDVINADPSANIDARVVEVKVQLDEASSRKVSEFSNLQVTVEIEV